MDHKQLTVFFNKLDRAYFIDNENKAYAYLDQALPIGYGQTISQPSLVLEMTYRLDPDKSCKVLEVGTGSGYQTAILAEFAGEVCTIELIPELAAAAREKLEALGYKNICYKIGDGSRGWAEKAPFDRIIATAAAGRIPTELFEQLKPGGKMIIPVGPMGVQDLMMVTKDDNGIMHTMTIEQVMFVEFKGEYGWAAYRDGERREI